MEAHSIESVRQHVKVYWIVFFSLLVLTGVTVGVAYLHLPIGQAILVALLIACIKATLVGGYFMHLMSEKKIIYAVLILTLVFFVALMCIPMAVDSEVVYKAKLHGA